MVQGESQELALFQGQTTVPSDFQQYLSVVRYETLKYLRSKRLLAILIILALIIGLILSIPPALGHDYPDDALEFAGLFISFAGILVILCFTFFGADAIVSEFQQKTGYLLFPNPLKRIVILFGKFTASFLASMLVIIIYYGVVVISIGAVNHSVPGEVGLSLLFCVMYLLSGLSIAYLLSSLMKGTTGANVLTFFLFFLILPIIESVFTFAGVKPSLSITFASGIIYFILVVPYPKDIVEEFTMGGDTIEIHQFYPEVALSLLVMFFYLIIAFLLTYFIFERKEMK
ncbi:MAG: ABC transporter permease [Thermoplasmata archaeon]|nr:MAG: ABC transporter permease [Thermoplasmata archaeon]